MGKSWLGWEKQLDIQGMWGWGRKDARGLLKDILQTAAHRGGNLTEDRHRSQTKAGMT